MNSRCLATIGALCVVACSDTGPSASSRGGSRVETLTIRGTLALSAGDTSRLTAIMLDSNNTEVRNRRPTWSSSNSFVAAVDSNGTVVARSPGTSQIGAAIDGRHAEATVTVTATIASFVLSPSTISLGSDSEFRTVFKDAAGREIPIQATLAFSDTTIARLLAPAVSSTAPPPSFGIFTVRTGDELVTATVGHQQLRATLHIVNPVIDTIAASLTSLLVPAGESRTLDTRVIVATHHPGISFAGFDRAVDFALNWTSSNPSVATVDASGAITGRAPGNATVIASALGKSMTIAVHVIGHMAVRFTDVAPGRARTCALDDVGQAYCWGDVSGPAYGDGSGFEIMNNGSTVPTRGSTIPLLVAGGQRFSTLATGQAVDLNCGITTSGDTYCWTNTAAPVRVDNGLRFSAVTAGANHACGLTSVGDVYCWGSNARGQLGNGGTADSPAPTHANIVEPVSSISAGGVMSCALGRSGTVYCWGSSGDTFYPIVMTPTALSTTLTFRAVSVGTVWPCGIATNGFVYCWGPRGPGGQLTVSQLDSTTPMRTLGLGIWLVCGMRSDNIAGCYSRNEPETPATTFKPIDGDPGFTSLATGYAGCGFTATGVLYCFGENDRGQAGAVPLPVTVRGVWFAEVARRPYADGVNDPHRIVGQALP